MTLHHHHYHAPITYGDPSSPYPRVPNHYPTPHHSTQWYTPLPSNSPSRFARKGSQNSERRMYAEGYFPPDPAFTQWNAAALVPRGRHAFYGPELSIPNTRPRDLPLTHAQTPTTPRPHDRLDGAQRRVGLEKSRKFRGISAGRNQPRAQGLYNIIRDNPAPLEHCTPPLGQVPGNLFTQVSISPQTYQPRPYEDKPPFVLPKSKLPHKLARAWRRVWH